MLQPGGWMNFGGRRGSSRAAARRVGRLAQSRGLAGRLSGLAGGWTPLSALLLEMAEVLRSFGKERWWKFILKGGGELLVM
ncbi:hypothetical protein Tco_0363794 [Tanacetum coccineum]